MGWRYTVIVEHIILKLLHQTEGLKSPTKNCIKCSIELKVYQKKFQFFLVAIAVVIILYRIPIITVGAVAGKAYLMHGFHKTSVA